MLSPTHSVQCLKTRVMSTFQVVVLNPLILALLFCLQVYSLLDDWTVLCNCQLCFMSIFVELYCVYAVYRNTFEGCVIHAVTQLTYT